VPAGRIWGPGYVQSVSLAVERNGLEKQLVTRCPFDLNDKMVPGVVHGIAWNAGGYPLLVHVIVGVPFVTAGDPAFMPPNERLSARELINIELKRLGSPDILRVKVDFIDEVMKVGNQGVTRIQNVLRREAPDNVVIPQDVGVSTRTTDMVLGRATADRRRRNSWCARPVHTGGSRRAARTNAPTGRQQRIS